jgi:hypothetical protein
VVKAKLRHRVRKTVANKNQLHLVANLNRVVKMAAADVRRQVLLHHKPPQA